MSMDLKTSVFSPTYKMIGNHYSYPYNEKAKLDKLKFSEFLRHTKEMSLQGKLHSQKLKSLLYPER